jgi:hypothetical protein
MSRHTLKEPLHLHLVPSTPINLVQLQLHPQVRHDRIQELIRQVKAPLPKLLLGTSRKLMVEVRLTSLREPAQDSRRHNRPGRRPPMTRELGSVENSPNLLIIP